MTSLFGLTFKSGALNTVMALGLRYAVAIGAIVFIFSFKKRLGTEKRWVNRLSFDSLGYYACQYIALFVLTSILSAQLLHGLLIYQLVVFVLTLGSSTVLVIMLNRSAFARQYLLGKGGRPTAPRRMATPA